MAVDTLLLELGAEELPPNRAGRALTPLRDGIEKGLADAEIPFASAVTAYATPRRLAVQGRPDLPTSSQTAK